MSDDEKTVWKHFCLWPSAGIVLQALPFGIMNSIYIEGPKHETHYEPGVEFTAA